MAKWTPTHEAPEPLEGPVVPTIVGGTVLWFVLFVVQVPFYGWFEDHGHTWWVWTCLAGAGLGLIGIWYVRRRETAIRRATADRHAGGGADGRAGSGADGDAGTDGGGDGDTSGTPAP
ncbi:DUF2530 domain-containing protein [Streptomyces sp. NBC_01498]|uniref:DUF2530 domain-containing protein n=1 Tax=Streptomyces sp. NBC_01498 TaxID=2975870 RepID=UPI002E7ABABE|nr:DUF2530 domain-containing protein [Streptomyces sp. NBC_01498]WTL26233.1 DUF2530 domain-containing protein [Streptomyces sp. NBC_01498]